ncbi:UNVERIFIED_CONTAM: movement protein [Sesamum radiatum]|uniref:Movement protein n=1 Tax=Sesamum radiatum TaxID=300843 RepID=A0AAW2VS06_SESRA
MDRRINNLRDGCLGTMIGNLYGGKLMFDIHPGIAYNLADQDFSRVLTLHQDFKSKDLMKEGNKPYSITYRIAYALSNTHHSDLFLRKENIEIPRISKEFAKVMTPDPIRIPRIGGVNIVIKYHPVLERTLSTRTEFRSRMSFSEDRITGYKGKEKQPVIGRYEGMLEIAGHEILVAGRDFSQKILILNKGIREAKIMIGGAFGTPWFRMNMEDKKDMQIIIKEHINLEFIEPRVSAYSNPGFLKGFSITFERNRNSKWKWEEIHTQRDRELKQVCSKLPKFAIPQDEDELVVYTDANDYRWAAVLMKKTATGEELCRYTGELFFKTTSPSLAHQREGILCSLEGFQEMASILTC